MADVTGDDLDSAREDESASPEDQRKPYVHDVEVHGRDFRVEGNDVRDYVGVDPEYRTYANPGDAPILTDTERFDYTDQYDHLTGNFEEDRISVKEYELTDSQRQILRDAGEPAEDEVTLTQESSETGGSSETETKKEDDEPSPPLFPTP